MKKQIFDIIVILALLISLLVISYFGLLEKSARYMFLFILAFYYLGQYSERKFQKQ